MRQYVDLEFTTPEGTTPPVVHAQMMFSAEEQAQGLMHVRSLGENEGMLFVWSEPGIHPFWMHETPLALDIVWISSGHVVAIERGDPLSDRMIRPDVLSNCVLEVNAGWCDRYALTVGSVVTYTFRGAH